MDKVLYYFFLFLVLFIAAAYIYVIVFHAEGLMDIYCSISGGRVMRTYASAICNYPAADAGKDCDYAGQNMDYTDDQSGCAGYCIPYYCLTASNEWKAGCCDIAGKTVKGKCSAFLKREDRYRCSYNETSGITMSVFID